MTASLQFKLIFSEKINQVGKLFLALIAILLLFPATLSFGQEAQAMKGVLRIKFNENMTRYLDDMTVLRNNNEVAITGLKNLDALNKLYKAKVIKRVFPHAGKYEAKHRKHNLHLWYEINLDANEKIGNIVAAYSRLGEISIAEPIYAKTIVGANQNQSTDDPAANAVPNDPQFANQWHYANVGQSGGTPGADIDLVPAWDIETGSDEVIVSVHDGGIDVDHEDLAAAMWVNHDEIPGNGIDDDGNGYVDDIHGFNYVNNTGGVNADGHGTHVGGTVGAVNNNNIGVSGVAGGSGSADGARLMSIQVFQGLFGTANDFATGYVYAADNGAIISQNSWGYTSPGYYEQAVLDGIDYFIAEAGLDENGTQVGPMAGGIVIFAAGNSNSQGNYYPGYYEPVLAVAATNHNDVKADYSNFGSWVDISAPGGDAAAYVLSTLPNNKYGGNGYYGTSMACPHVSGVAALIIAKFGGEGYTPGEVRSRLVDNVDDVYSSNPNYIGKLGSGRLNALKALDGEGEPTDLEIVSFTLVDAVTNLDIATLVDSSIIDLSTLPNRRINVRANTNPETVGSVVFQLGNRSTTDNGAPYTIAGDNNNGNYNGVVPPLVIARITAQPFSGPSGTGEAGIPFTVRVKFVDRGAREFTVFPNPVEDQLNIRIPQDYVGALDVQLISQHGKTVDLGNYQINGEENLSIDVSGLNLRKGLGYYVQIKPATLAPKTIRLVKE